jgi:hypothetical protein
MITLELWLQGLHIGGGVMLRHPGRLTIASLLLAIFGTPNYVRAEILQPTGVTYKFDVENDGPVRTCAIKLLITSLPAPESVTFKYIMMKNKQPRFFAIRRIYIEQL